MISAYFLYGQNLVGSQIYWHGFRAGDGRQRKYLMTETKKAGYFCRAEIHTHIHAMNADPQTLEDGLSISEGFCESPYMDPFLKAGSVS